MGEWGCGELGLMVVVVGLGGDRGEGGYLSASILYQLTRQCAYAVHQYAPCVT